ncbi:MAG TPA: c-type cytochrome [Kofleriaceae bacterium]|nr:c-type cytochrome [Kofleriaceae bacterium]
MSRALATHPRRALRVGSVGLAGLAGLVALAGTAPACNAGSASPSPAARSGEAPRDAAADADLGRLAGKPLYLALCAPCHGADARGYAADHAPSLVSPTFLESASDAFLGRSIRAGRPGTSMAAYARELGGPLDAAAIDRLVAFLRAQGPAARPLPAPSPGDLATGAAVYGKHCLTCHGDATRRGEAVSLINPELQLVASDAFLRHAVAHGRPGTKMEPFEGKLTDAEIDGVVRFVRSLGNGGAAAIQPLPAPTGKEPIVLNPGGKAPRFTLRADPCPPAAPGAPPCKPDLRYASIDEVAAAYAARQRMVIIDARPPSEWMRVHITGAVSIPYHDMKRLDEIPRDGTWIIAYCACPHHLSGIVVDELRKRGYAHAVVLDEGINEWHRRGLPVTAAEGVPRPLPEPSAPPGTLR